MSLVQYGIIVSLLTLTLLLILQVGKPYSIRFIFLSIFLRQSKMACLFTATGVIDRTVYEYDGPISIPAY